MAITLKGMNSLTNKLNKLSNLKAKESVNKVAKTVESGLRNEASKFSNKGYNYIGKVDSREYRNGNYFVEIGLKNDSAPWDEWKHLYFHHYGYHQFMMGFPTSIYTNMYQFWFTNVIENLEQGVLKELKKEIRKEIRETMK